MEYINFICGGKTGDLIHYSLYIKNVCQILNKKAILHITNDAKFGGFKFTLDLETTAKDLKKLYQAESYIKDIRILDESFIDNKFININFWVQSISKRCWGNFFKKDLKLKYNKNFDNSPWISTNKEFLELKNKILIHRSIHRHSRKFPWKSIIEKNECFFVTCTPKEYDIFPFKSQVKLFLCKDLYELSIAINSSKIFIGNLSTPSAIAHAMHKSRLFELENTWYTQFIGEENFYNNYNYIGDRAYYVNPQINNYINFYTKEIRKNPPQNKFQIKNNI
jgi:hypothetical protein